MITHCVSLYCLYLCVLSDVYCIKNDVSLYCAHSRRQGKIIVVILLEYRREAVTEYVYC